MVQPEFTTKFPVSRNGAPPGSLHSCLCSNLNGMGLNVCSTTFSYNVIITSTHLGSTPKSAKALIQGSTGIVHLPPPTTPSDEQDKVCAPPMHLNICICIFLPQARRPSKAGQHTTHVQPALNAQYIRIIKMA